jgi:LysM repeat protein
MTEKELRELVVATATEWLGRKKADGSHKVIIDTYNAHKPLARGYKVKYTDAWCSTFASAVAIKAGLTDIIPTECGCEKHIALFKQLGSWQERDDYKPSPGDYIFYDWDDSDVGDNTGHSDHVGIVVAVSGAKIKVIEGNMSNKVGYRTIAVNGKYIRGYGVPKYSSKATVSPKPASKAELDIGDTVMFTGSLHYTNSSAKGTAKGCKGGLARVNGKAPGTAHPYHVIAIVGKGATVYGWVNAEDVSAVTENSGKSYVVKPGDTLSKIARQYGTTVDKIASLNNIRYINIIRVGQIIKLP